MSHSIRTNWPVLKTYSGDNLRKIAMPVGGIGTGSISLAGNGALINWEIMNRPALNHSPAINAFLIRVEQENLPIFAKVLEGPLDTAMCEGPFGAEVKNHGMPRFRSAMFKAAYPFGQVCLVDDKAPVKVTIKSFNPLIPSDTSSSSYPVMVYRCEVENLSNREVIVSIASNISNFIKPHNKQKSSHFNHNKFVSEKNYCAIAYHSDMTNVYDENYGNFSIAILNPINVSYRTSWADLTWRDSLLDMWDDFIEDGSLDQRNSINNETTGSLCDKRFISAGGVETFDFVISWFFPNRYAWSIEGENGTSPPGTNIGAYSDLIIGNFYATKFHSSLHVIDKFVPEIAQLENRTMDFVYEVLKTGFPSPLIEAALSNLSTLKTQTMFQSSDGKYFGWEGIGYDAGSCFGNCTHVWNYEQTTPYLFSEISRDFRETEFKYMINRDGFMAFRVTFPLHELQAWPIAAADGQMGCVVKLYREWSLSGDTEWLRTLWPSAKKALEFAWIPGGWDADQDGVMEGVQHNTMDVEYYGPNPQMGFWYLAALRAAEEISLELLDFEFARKCRELFDNGRDWIESNLFNGEYYEHKIFPLRKSVTIAKGLRHGVMGAQDTANPELQLGSGCLIDQMIGQFLADLTGLGSLGNPENLRRAAKSVYEYNKKEDLFDHFNHMNSNAIGNESGWLMATYPKGNRPNRPFPYFTTIMTGYEYSLAGSLIFSQQYDLALDVIKKVRERFSGMTRNPFGEAECGRHYSRAMIAWGLFLAWTGQNFSAKSKSLRFRSDLTNTSLPWFVGSSWGTVQLVKDQLILEVKEGLINIDKIDFQGDQFLRVEIDGTQTTFRRQA